MLEHVNHPFICNLRYSFQDIEYMYLVVDLMSGGDLRFHISRKTFTEEAVRFWISELGCALKYIHGQGIIHRDVKPDNVLLDADGHVHLTDFVCALSCLLRGASLTCCRTLRLTSSRAKS
jgi:serine/threonine kinase 32